MKGVAEMKRHPRLRQGGWLAATTAVVIAIVVMVNLIVGELPTHMKEFDLSGNQLYTVSDASKEFLAGLDEDVEIVMLAEPSAVDRRVSKFLDNYAALSDRVTLTQVDPVAHPSAAEEYGASAGSIIVRCGGTGKSRTITLDSVISYDQMYYYMYGQKYETEFDAEGQLTSALDYVTGDTGKVIYTLESHGETELGDTVKSAIEKANLTLSSVSLPLAGAVPEDCALLISCGAEKDLTEAELEMVRAYLDGGGQVFFLLAQTEETLPNWERLLAEYGLELEDGYVADTRRFYQQLGSYYDIAPVLSGSSPITAGFASGDLSLLVNARGMNTLEELPENVSVTGFLTTSEGGVAVTADGTQTQGTYVLGAVSEKTDDGGNGAGRLTVVSSASLVDESVLAVMSNGVNLDIFMNALTAGFDDISAVSIPAKSLETSYNTIANVGLWSLPFVAVIPILTLAVGLVYWLRRRRL